MSYDILIGNAELEAEWDVSEFGSPSAEWVVNLHSVEGAPAFPYDFQPGANCRSPGYSQWREWCRATGLHELFYGCPPEATGRHDGGILSDHPGIVPITPEMVAQVGAARQAWEFAHPGAIPGWDFNEPFHPASHVDDGVRGRDPMLARLLWLEWWMMWAVEHCERPAIYNR